MTDSKELPEAYKGLGYHELNAMLNLYGKNGEIQFDADRAAARQYFLQHVNNNTVFFHDLEEKLDYLVKNDYYERETLDQYTMNFIRELYNRAYKKKFRFETFLGAFKFYTSYTLKTFDGKRYLERYEDRVCMVALHLARGNEQLAEQMVDEIIEGRFQPATPTFLNVEANRALIRGVIGAGNTNFGENYCLAADIIAVKCKVPVLYRFELMGTSEDVAKVNQGLEEFWTHQSQKPA